MKRTNATGELMDVANPNISEMYQTLDYVRVNNISQGKLAEMGGQFFPVKTIKEFDLLTTYGKYIELKNKDFQAMTELPKGDVDQLIEGTLARVTSLNDFDWVAFEHRFSSKGAGEAQVKRLWREALTASKIKTFNYMNATLKTELEIISVTDLTTEKIEMIVDKIVKVQ